MAKKTCPVCDWEIKDEGKQIKLDGKTVTVCCDACAKKFRADPQKYRKKG